MTDLRIGYALSSEEHRPRDLVRNAARAEAAGFDFAMLSDHFHPWLDRQGQPTAAIPGDSGQELPLPSSFESLAELVTEDAIAEKVACGPDPAVHEQAIRSYLDAGFDHVYLHQVGPDQAGFIDFAKRELLPRLRGGKARRKAA